MTTPAEDAEAFVAEVRRLLQHVKYPERRRRVGDSPLASASKQTSVQRPWRSEVKTRAKFYVSSLELLPGQPGIKVHLRAVGRGDRNASWAAASPEGEMHMTVNNPAAAVQWEAFMQESRATGKAPEVFIDIYAATDGWAGDGHRFRAGVGESGTSFDARYCGECGTTIDAKVTQWDAEQGKHVEVGLAHPNG
jgi:hypothetical protein